MEQKESSRLIAGMNREPTTAARPDPLNDASQRPPPLQVRYFYTAQASVDEPLALVAPPAPASTVAPNHPPRPFSEYDSTRLDKAWNELRLKLAEYKEQVKAEEESRAAQQKAGGNGSRPATATSKKHDGTEHNLHGRTTLSKSLSTARSPLRASDFKDKHLSLPLRSVEGTTNDGFWVRKRRGSSLSQQMNASSDNDSDAHGGDAEDSADGLTRSPFARAPARSKLAQSSRPTHTTASEGDEHLNRPEDDAISTEAKHDPKEPVSKTTVGASRLQQVVMPSLKYVLLVAILWT